MIILNVNKKCAPAHLFGIKGLSISDNQISIEDFLNQDNKEVFIALDKNMFNSDLKFLEEVLIKLSKEKIKGVFFYDISVLSIVKRLNLDINLIWAGDFLTTNYKTIDFYKKDGVKGISISNLLTIDEICEIIEKVQVKTFVNIFGYQLVAVSKRNLISNYFEYINEEKNNDIYTMIERGKEYKTKEDEYGTKIYSNYILNGIKYLKKLKDSGVDYIILNDFEIDKKIFSKVLSIYKKALDFKDDLDILDKEINSLIETETGFFDKKTIYRVKKND